MRIALDEARVQKTIRKNTATSYGLTLVAGLPLPSEIGNRIQAMQAQLETLAPGRFAWYEFHHLHATLIAPLRGRYRDSPPLQRDELPADLQGFTQKLNDFFAQQQPYALDLAGVNLTSGGFVLVGESTLVGQLSSRLQGYPELDPPKHPHGSHVAIGYLNTVQPFSTDEERMRFEQTLAQFTDVPVGKMLVQQVWLVHYANRTLDQILGKVPFTLGRANVITGERLLRELGIATV